MTAILDGYIHLMGSNPATGGCLAELTAAGVSSGALISQPPASFGLGAETPVTRLQQILDWRRPKMNLSRSSGLTRCSNYNMVNNAIFDTDWRAPGCSVAWAQVWHQWGEEILTSLGLGQDLLDKVRGENLRRFHGLSDQRVERVIPQSGA